MPIRKHVVVVPLGSPLGALAGADGTLVVDLVELPAIREGGMVPAATVADIASLKVATVTFSQLPPAQPVGLVATLDVSASGDVTLSLRALITADVAAALAGEAPPGHAVIVSIPAAPVE